MLFFFKEVVMDEMVKEFFAFLAFVAFFALLCSSMVDAL